MRRLPALLLVLLLPTAAYANDTNYQNYVLGERALGLGGAYTAIADDVSGAFYNPAGTASVGSSSASLSISVYGVERRKVTRGYTANLDGTLVSVDLDDRSIATLPTTAGVLKKLSHGAVGLATYLRYADAQSTDDVLMGPVSKGAFTQSESDKTLWIGPFLGWRLTPQLSIGAAVFYTHRSVRRERSTATETEEADGSSSFLRLEDEVVGYSSGDLHARAGVKWQPHPCWRLGLMVSSPTAHVHGSAKLIDKVGTAMPGFISYDPKENDGLGTRDPQPVELRAGVAWGQDRARLAALDVTVETPLSFDPIDLPDPSDPASAIIDMAHVKTVKRELTVNVNLGGEIVLGGRVPLRGGVFTNFASSPSVVASNQNQLRHVNMFGATASVGYSAGDYDLSFGVLYSFGSGKQAAYDPSGAGGFVPANVRDDFVYFYLSGAKKALEKAAKQVVE